MAAPVVPESLLRWPWKITILLIVLTCFGAAVLHSAAGGSWEPYASKHLMRFSIFLVMAWIMSRFSEEVYRFLAYPVYIVLLLLLLVVEAIGFTGGGSQRWINLGFMTLQPSEMMKPAMVLVLARFYSALPPALVGTLRGIVPAMILVALPCALVLTQPDLGTTLAIVASGAVIVFIAGAPLKWFLVTGGGFAAALPFVYTLVLTPYQQSRVTTFLAPESDPLGEGYQITQSKIAIGSGGITGKGFGEGSQSHLAYLPEAHTDFIFATMAEEWGLLGGMFVIVCYGLILRWALRVAHRAPHRFGRLLAVGMGFTIFFYAAVNLLMVMGFAPVVGIPLPFLSHGGSSMLTVMICIGTLMAVDHWGKTQSRLRY